MTTDSQSYFSNAYPGEHETFGGNIYRLDKAPKYAVGFRISRQDGNVYRYSQYGAATNRGVLVAMDDSAAVVNNSDNALLDPTDAANSGDGAIGSKFIQIKSNTTVADQYSGGYLSTANDTGEGYTYRIKGNTTADTATGAPAAGQYRLELYDKLQVAIDSTTDIAIVGNMWSDLKIAVSGSDAAVSGVSCATATATYPYLFTQTWGVCTCLQSANVPGSAGGILVLSDVTSGAVGAFSGGSVGTVASELLDLQPIVGYCLDPAASAEHSTIYLQIAP